jgi:hypothetical protein
MLQSRVAALYQMYLLSLHLSLPLLFVSALHLSLPLLAAVRCMHADDDLVGPGAEPGSSKYKLMLARSTSIGSKDNIDMSKAAGIQ